MSILYAGVTMSTTTKILKRWIALDRELSSAFGVNLPTFAKKRRTTEKTVRRDLAAFREMRQKMYCHRIEGQGARARSIYLWKYYDETVPLFSANSRR